MSTYRNRLPQLEDGVFLTDGGLETTLIFHNKIELPYFAAFDLLRDAAGRETLRQYYLPYIESARRNGCGFILDSATWRSNPDWGRQLGYSKDALAAVNRDGIELLLELRAEYQNSNFPMVVSGAIGPRGDGYDPGQVMSVAEAEDYHSEQIAVFADTEADMIGAFTMTNLNEAIGITRAAQRYGIPAMVSFTLETDGRLPTGQELKDAIDAVDEVTGNGPAYYMINCAHPTHFESVLTSEDRWLGRLRGIRANASTRSHAELNEAPDLDDGHPDELGAQYGQLRRRFPQITILGGCCGTDHRHIEAIGSACCAIA